MPAVSSKLLIPLLLCGLTVATAQSPEKTVPEAVPLQQKYEAEIQKQVLPQHDAAVTDLKVKYAAAVTAQAESATRSGKLELAVALKAEVDLLSRGEEVPLTDKPGTPEPVKKLRGNYLSELTKLHQEKTRKLKPYRESLVKDLETLQATLTQAGRVDEALQIKLRIERLKAAASTGPTRISGQWNIRHCNNKESVWTFNKDFTYNYWDETGKYTYRGGKYLLTHTWDWEIRLVDDDTFVGICTRGKVGCEIEGRRIE